MSLPISLGLGRRCCAIQSHRLSSAASKAMAPSPSALVSAPAQLVIQSSTNSPAITSTLFLQQRTISSTPHFKMPTYIVSCKDDASDDQVKSAKQHAIDQGGKIEHEYSIIKGFSVSFPEGTVTTLDSHEAIKIVEADGVATTQ